MHGMGNGPEKLPEDIEALHAALLATRAELAIVRAQQSDDHALIAHLKLQIEKLNRDRYGPRSERTARLLDQLELTLEELEASATEDELAAEIAAIEVTNASTTVASFTRRRPSRKPLPEHLPRERVIVPGPVSCACCGGARLSKLGEDITETLEVIPKSWKVIQHVREKFSCRDCEKISQAPAPFHVIARGWAGPSLLAMVLFEKFGQHQPLNRQAERYAKEGVPISLSTLADQVGGCTVALTPLFQRLEAHVLRAERLHGDDTTVPVLAKGKTSTARIWVPAHQRDGKFLAGRCLWRLWQALQHGPQCRSDFGGRVLGSCPTAVLRDGRSGRECAPLAKYRAAFFKRSRSSSTRLTCARRRKISLRWAGSPGCSSDRGGDRAALMYSMIVTAKMNDVDPQAWLSIADPICREQRPSRMLTV